jgi:cyclopropane fatty-acyl-phospholipid synthase-like methyltransferase
VRWDLLLWMNEQGDKKSWSTKEYWQGRFKAADTPWELGAPSEVLLEACAELDALGVSLEGVRLLSPGCGRGADALELAARGATVVGVEWSDQVAHDLISRYKTAYIPGRGSLEVRIGDFFALNPEPVDIVCEHTFLCALDPSRRVDYAQRIAAWLKPGGYLCGNFFIVSDDDARQLPGLSLTKEGEGPPFGITKDGLLELLKERFSPLVLRPAIKPALNRRPGLEWVGVFKRLS